MRCLFNIIICLSVTSCIPQLRGMYEGDNRVELTFGYGSVSPGDGDLFCVHTYGLDGNAVSTVDYIEGEGGVVCVPSGDRAVTASLFGSGTVVTEGTSTLEQSRVRTNVSSDMDASLWDEVQALCGCASSLRVRNCPDPYLAGSLRHVNVPVRLKGDTLLRLAVPVREVTSPVMFIISGVKGLGNASSVTVFCEGAAEGVMLSTMEPYGRCVLHAPAMRYSEESLAAAMRCFGLPEVGCRIFLHVISKDGTRTGWHCDVPEGGDGGVVEMDAAGLVIEAPDGGGFLPTLKGWNETVYDIKM